MQHYCAACEKPASLVCSICRNVYFCNKDCQKAQWKLHKPFCQPAKGDGGAHAKDSATERKAQESLRNYTEFVRAVEKGAHIPPQLQSAIQPLLTQETFCKLLYSGTLLKDVSPDLPRTVLQMLEHKGYQTYISQGAIKAVEFAEHVLQKVASQGAATGDTMTEEIRKELWPLTFSKAFQQLIPEIHSRYVVDMNKKAEALTLATPYHALAASEYILPSSLKPLLELGIAMQRGPFTKEADIAAWSELSLDDLAAMVKENKAWSEPRKTTQLFRCGAQTLEAVVHHSYLFPAIDTLEMLYPALGEVSQRLYAIPYELSRKIPELRLAAAPLPGRTVVEHFQLTIMPAATAAASGKPLSEYAELYPQGLQPYFPFRTEYDVPPGLVAKACFGAVVSAKSSDVAASLQFVTAAGKAFNADAMNQLLLFRPMSGYTTSRIRVQVKESSTAAAYPTIHWYTLLHIIETFREA